MDSRERRELNNGTGKALDRAVELVVTPMVFGFFGYQRTTVRTAPPIIGRCPKCQAEIRASHPYAWCIKCNEQLPYRINMERRPIIYGTPEDWRYTFGAGPRNS